MGAVLIQATTVEIWIASPNPVSSQSPVHHKEMCACPSELEERKSFLCCDTVSCSPKRSKAAAAFSLATLQMWLGHLSTRTCVKLTGVSIQDFLLGLKGKKNIFQPSKQNRLWFYLVISLPQWLRDLGAPERLWAYYLHILHGDSSLPFPTDSLESLAKRGTKVVICSQPFTLI